MLTILLIGLIAVIFALMIASFIPKDTYEPDSEKEKKVILSKPKEKETAQETSGTTKTPEKSEEQTDEHREYEDPFGSEGGTIYEDKKY